MTVVAALQPQDIQLLQAQIEQQQAQQHHHQQQQQQQQQQAQEEKDESEKGVEHPMPVALIKTGRKLLIIYCYKIMFIFALKN